MIEVSHVSALCLHDVSFRLPSASMTIVIGAVGSGKSTLLDLLAGVVKPERGDVFYDGESLFQGRHVSVSLRKKIGYVFQQPEKQLFATTVRKEIAFSLRPYALSQEAREARMATTFSQLGLATALYEQAPLQLSGGYQRKVAIASTLVTHPTWLLFDEPSAGLDHRSQQALLAQLAWEKERLTDGGIVIATHDLDLFLPIADQIILVKEGSIFAIMTYDALLADLFLLDQAGIGVTDGLWIAAYERGYHPDDTWIDDEVFRDCSPNAVTSAEFLAETSSSGYDPRALWLLFMGFSLLLLLRSSGWLLGGALLVFMVLTIRYVRPLRSLTPLLLPVLLFGCLAVVFAGIVPGGFSFSKAAITARSYGSFLLLYAYGVLFASRVSSRRLAQAIYCLLAMLPSLRFFADLFSFSIALVFRFVTVVQQAWLLFLRIFYVRQKPRRQNSLSMLRALPVLLIPMLLFLLQYAQDYTIALELRGLTKFGRNRTWLIPLSWKRKDTVLVVIGVLCFTFLSILTK